MQIASMEKLITDFRNAGHLPVEHIADQSEAGKPHVVADLIVNLGQAVSKAHTQGARSLDIYADTLILGKGEKPGITDTLSRLTIIARRIVAGDGAKIVLSHRSSDSSNAFRVYCGEIQGDLEIISDNQLGNTPYSLDALSKNENVPHFTNFIFLDNELAVRSSVLPVGMLTDGRPLQQMLAASFTLGIWVISKDDTSNNSTEIAHHLFGWIAGWSGLQNDIAQIARLAERLQGIVPRYDNGTFIVPVPPRTAASYLTLCKSRLDLTNKIELDSKFLEQTGTVTEIAHAFNAANISRDAQDLSLIDKEINVLEARTSKLQLSLRAAASSMLKQEFESKLNKIDLELAIELDRIDKIVQAAFDITIGVISLGGSIAAICMGVPADPGASAKKDIKGVKGLVDTLKDAKEGRVAVTDFKSLMKNIVDLYKIPFTFVWAHKSDMKDSFKALASSAMSIKSAQASIANSGNFGEHIEEVIETLNAALRNLAGKPDATAAKAAWDALELATTNELDRAINDSATAAGIKDAATKYKSTIQKVAVYGRLMADHQAELDANQRDLASRLLQRCTQVMKEGELIKLQDTFTDRTELNEHIKAEMNERLAASARSFFAACYGYRRAQFYETFTLPATSVMIISHSADMTQVQTGLTTDFSDAQGIINSQTVKLSKSTKLTDQEVIESLLSGEGTTWVLNPDDFQLDGYSRVRLSTIRMHLETKQQQTGEVILEFTSGGTFLDRKDGAIVQFAGSVVDIPYAYRDTTTTAQKTLNGVQPTPFAPWLVQITNTGGITSAEVLTIDMELTALR